MTRDFPKVDNAVHFVSNRQINIYQDNLVQYTIFTENSVTYPVQYNMNPNRETPTIYPPPQLIPNPPAHSISTDP